MALTPNDLNAIRDLIKEEVTSAVKEQFLGVERRLCGQMTDVEDRISRVEANLTGHLNDVQRANTRHVNVLRQELKENGALPA